MYSELDLGAMTAGQNKLMCLLLIGPEVDYITHACPRSACSLLFLGEDKVHDVTTPAHDERVAFTWSESGVSSFVFGAKIHLKLKGAAGSGSKCFYRVIY